MELSYEEFLKICFGVENIEIVEDGDRWSVGKDYMKYIDKNIFLEVTWVSGGSTGNSYAGISNDPVTPENPVSLDTAIAEILFALDYDVSFVTYNRKIKPLIENFERYSTSDYYGNYYAYAGLKLNMKSFYEAIYN